MQNSLQFLYFGLFLVLPLWLLIGSSNPQTNILSFGRHDLKHRFLLTWTPIGRFGEWRAALWEVAWTPPSYLREGLWRSSWSPAASSWPGPDHPACLAPRGSPPAQERIKEINIRPDSTSLRLCSTPHAPPLSGAKAGRNHFDERNTPPPPIGIGQRYSQTISNLCQAALSRRCELSL